MHGSHVSKWEKHATRRYFNESERQLVVATIHQVGICLLVFNLKSLIFLQIIL
jgi:hypothetical protein